MKRETGLMLLFLGLTVGMFVAWALGNNDHGMWVYVSSALVTSGLLTRFLMR